MCFVLHTADPVPGPAQPETHQSYDVRPTPQEMPIADLYPRRMNTHQHLVIADDGQLDLLELKDVIGQAVLLLHDRLHRVFTSHDPRSAAAATMVMSAAAPQIPRKT